MFKMKSNHGAVVMFARASMAGVAQAIDSPVT
jgi:hypothetical protein